MRHTIAILLGCSLLVCPASLAADWLEFRGPGGSSVSTAQGLPVEFSDAENLAWKVKTPGRGVAGALVVGDRVVVTSSAGANQSKIYVLCYDAESGTELWRRQFWATGRSFCHPTSANAAPTPVSDGELIYAFYSSNDLVCLDVEGNLIWYRGLASDYPKAGNDVGMASSPVLAGDVVVVQVENQGESFVAGLDRATGETTWRIDRPAAANWASPHVMQTRDGDQIVVLQSGQSLVAVSPVDGSELWRRDEGCSTVTSSVSSEGVLFVPSEGLTALAVGEDGVQELWRRPNINPSNPSPVVYLDKLYTINGSGVLNCATTSGEPAWKLRLDGRFWATPVAADGRLYCVNQDGLVQVVSLDGQGEVIAENQLDAEVLASPAVGDDGIYFRTTDGLWKAVKSS